MCKTCTYGLIRTLVRSPLQLQLEAKGHAKAKAVEIPTEEPPKARDASTSKAESKGCGKGSVSKNNLKKGWFHSYSLVGLSVPAEAWPDPNRTHYGRHSYTLVSGSGEGAAPSQKLSVGGLNPSRFQLKCPWS